ncbi:glycosyltransferase family 39 protein [Mucilaginibacter sp. UR6-11]|uniref:ArnT family glycosyltransferase n=1 Tax=Mucilaginibacter sp. UR6-11 TaxID=1435644 RepID=UPI001E480845|nr:glycosyltransferase family 39 protein [Mucilaginibacter sp. UR6-11]MCC8425625.1 glycosyltransferase family 39 protein [Mucilaginibacter sp. UR6-11]
MKNKDKPIFLLLFVLAFAVNIAGINVKFFTDDPGLYASIAKNLIYKHDILQLFTYNQDWLDKPHFPFWMAMLSFKLFGISVWAYRLPALLFFLISARYTYLFARKYYDWEAAAVAVLILMTAQYVIMSNTDVRAEPYLMGLVIGSIYHITNLEQRFTLKDLLLAALLTACAIMTKGIFVIVAIYGSLLGQLIFTRKIAGLFSPRFIGLYLLTLLFTLPEFYALYLQFDLHPEKLVFERHNVSGIKWFLWDSQFGRFVNNGPISRNKSGDVFFYLHTLLWAFAPWCLMFYYAVYKRLRQIYYKTPLPEYYTLSGGLLLLLLFSLSRFQLPFYANTIFPLFAIITAPYCYRQLSVFGNKFRLINQWVYIALLTLVIFVINFFLKPAGIAFFALDCGLFFSLIALINKQVKDLPRKTFFVSCSAALFANFYLAIVLYPTIAAYSGQVVAAGYINQPRYDQYHIYSARMESNVFQFECKRPVDYLPAAEFSQLDATKKNALYATQFTLNYLIANHIPYRVIKSFQNYPQERILPKFINSTTRKTVLDTVYLITK